MGETEDLIEEFVTESREHIADIENDLINIEAAGEDMDKASIDRVFRAAHSIKGSAKFLDLSKIGDLAHIMEDVLNLIRSGKISTDRDVAGALLQGSDMLKLMFDNVDASNDMDIHQQIDVLQVILNKNTREPQKKAGQQGRDNAPQAIPLFDVTATDLNEYMKKGQVFVLQADADQISRLGDLGDVLDTKEDGQGKTLVLFFSIMEADMIPLATDVDKDEVRQVEEEMVNAITIPALSKPSTPPPEAVVKPEAENKEPQEKKEKRSNSYITFLLESEIYAINMENIEEITGLQDLSLLPNVPDFVNGVVNLRGELVPIVDMRKQLGLEAREVDAQTVYIVLRIENRVVGIVVDSVSDVLVIDDPGRIQKTPFFASKISSDAIHGVYRDQDEEMIILVNVEKLITPQDWIAA